jgi:hypothetical protein
MKIKSKKDMYALQNQNLLGNYLPTWHWQEFLRAGPDGNYGFRHRTITGSPLFKRGMDREQVIDYVSRLLFVGKISEQDVVISQDTSLFDDCRTLQGEVATLAEPPYVGLTFAYSGKLAAFTQFTCREEVRQPQLVTLVGLRAASLLQAYLDVPSYDDLQRLLRDYPDSTIELTAFSKDVGIFGLNTIFWECRDF